MVKYLNNKWFNELDRPLVLDGNKNYHSDEADDDRDKALASFRALGGKTTFYLLRMPEQGIKMRCW
ncbi:MAG: hypothetical protein AB7F64_08905 [Gammaproteobacteria bacterium]